MGGATVTTVIAFVAMVVLGLAFALNRMFAGGGNSKVVAGDPSSRPIGLRPGMVAVVRGQRYEVRGSITLTQGPWRWYEHLLVPDPAPVAAPEARIWLSIEGARSQSLFLWTGVTWSGATPDGASFWFDDTLYATSEGGTASYEAVGDTGLGDPTGTVHYRDYASVDGALLSFESFVGASGGQREVGRGEPLKRTDITVIAAPRRGRPG